MPEKSTKERVLEELDTLRTKVKQLEEERDKEKKAKEDALKDSSDDGWLD